MVNCDLEQELQQNLGADGKPLWTGKPKAGVVFRSSDVLMIPFSLLWCGFACFWEFSVVSTKAPFFFKLWGIPFVLVGLYIVIGRFFVDAAKRKKTVYGLTKDRVIIKSRLLSQEIKSLNIKTISDISLRQSENKAEQ
jgi:hypothetical protein